jgi:PAS domain S-box-containing protein
MPAPSTELAKHAKLRRDAETRLKEGSAPPTTGWSVGVNALSLLHKLASTPASAVDALKLLHELQVHQVELDLQREQIDITQREIAEDLARYQYLYECAPVAYLEASSQREILECNIAAASLFGIEPDELRGRGIDSFLAPASRPVLLLMLKGLRADGASASCEVRVGTGKTLRKLQVLARAAPGGRSFLVAFLDLTGLDLPERR